MTCKAKELSCPIFSTREKKGNDSLGEILVFGTQMPSLSRQLATDPDPRALPPCLRAEEQGCLSQRPFSFSPDVVVRLLRKGRYIEAGEAVQFGRRKGLRSTRLAIARPIQMLSFSERVCKEMYHRRWFTPCHGWDETAGERCCRREGCALNSRGLGAMRREGAPGSGAARADFLSA